ncbi:hypothetical protein [Sphaerobacter thermophilus]|jgi:hypothetical protein|uniref:Uncharacterized protein n=1 Tax=Sphaerobacter thermophilus (strain ATCC 49802 / DSM 20745 / KCCM 41009 / NCIMB 13125 / S 6022) TaxID=479434 RepID=D1C5Y9_SPHTD|nr:hypothetical protein [Sphaerobacter thermophilus]ACZ39541.1 hypothetical protein Sthe_2114 [Sphaerobacter thermophilus DSM 20745]PZN60637.1 MAG: hypothetical protein DIU58_15520 [Sphaerobacter thermophilus]
MRRGWVWVTVGVLLVIFIGLFVLLYLLGGADQSPLERTRDISIIFLSLSGVLVVLLLGALVGVMVWLALLLKDKVIPLLEQLTEAAARVRGTTEFVSEEVVSPIISAYGTVAGLRAMIRTVTGRDRRR